MMKKKSASCLLSILIVALLEPCFAKEYFVSPSGSDSNPGTYALPWKTPSYAHHFIRNHKGEKPEPTTLNFREGTYYLKQPLVFTSQDSGRRNAKLTYSAYKNEKVILSGGSKLQLTWKSFKNGIMQASVPDGIQFDQLFVHGVQRPMARYPNFDAKILPYNGFAADAFSPKRAASWANPQGGFIHAMHRSHWGGYHYRITGKNARNIVAYEGGWQNNRQMGMHNKHRFVENIFEELDSPGEWFHDTSKNILYYMPCKEEHLKTARIEVARRKHLVEFQGSRESPVRFVSISGLIFQHANRTFMETKEPLLRSDWTIYHGGAVFFNGAENCTIADCEFNLLGGNALFVNNYNRDITIQGCHIHHCGASGICFVGNPDAVRNPLFEYHQTLKYKQIDRTPGPKSDDYPADCLVDNCLIHNISTVEKQATGVQISMAKGITIRHCSIYDVSRAGINISEGTFGGHVIEFCDVFNTVRETGDHGSFNSWGRDRFWHLQDAPKDELPDLALLDAAKTVLRNNRWRCDHGWDVDLDDGSSNYDIYNNLFLHGGLKLREGFHRRVWNNIAINNTLHPHVWYSNSQDEVTRNIWMAGYRPAGGMPQGKWGAKIDHNFFIHENDRTAAAKHGCDRHSIFGDPMFVDPANGDYSLKKNSPAFKVGFKNFPMDQFGVQKPALKSIAKVPVFSIPVITTRSAENRNSATGKWLGATVQKLKGQEYSAYGISKEENGIRIVNVPEGSQAEKAGLKAGDVLLAVNGKATTTVDCLIETTESSDTKQRRNKPLLITLVRNQKKQTVTIP